MNLLQFINNMHWLSKYQKFGTFNVDPNKPPLDLIRRKIEKAIFLYGSDEIVTIQIHLGEKL